MPQSTTGFTPSERIYWNPGRDAGSGSGRQETNHPVQPVSQTLEFFLDSLDFSFDVQERASRCLASLALTLPAAWFHWGLTYESVPPQTLV